MASKMQQSVARKARRKRRPRSTDSGLKLSTKTYKRYSKQRSRVKSMVRRRLKTYGEAIDIDELINAFLGHEQPTSYGEMRKLTNYLEKIKSGEQLANLYAEQLTSITPPQVELPTEADLLIQNLTESVTDTYSFANDVPEYISEQYGVDTVRQLFQQSLVEMENATSQESLIQAYTELLDMGRKPTYVYREPDSSPYYEFVDTDFFDALVNKLQEGHGMTPDEAAYIQDMLSAISDAQMYNIGYSNMY